MAKVTKSDPKWLLAGERLRMIRKKRHLSQAGLAAKLPQSARGDRSEKTIGRFERGECAISGEYAMLLSQALGCRPQYLLMQDDFETDAHRFQNAIDTMNHEGNLLFTGLSAFAMLSDYSIRTPDISGEKSIEALINEVTTGFKITKGTHTISLSAAEMNQFENEVCDFVELKLKHLFKQKGVEDIG